MIWIICLLVLLGALLVVVELVLLPGVTLAAIGALGCYGGAAWLAYERAGVRGLLWVVVCVVALTIAATWFSLRTKTWRRFVLHDKIDGRSGEAPQRRVAPGARGVAVSRLAPMGTVAIDGETYEAKTRGGFLDQGVEVEVVGFENLNIIVKSQES